MLQRFCREYKETRTKWKLYGGEDDGGSAHITRTGADSERVRRLVEEKIEEFGAACVLHSVYSECQFRCLVALGWYGDLNVEIDVAKLGLKTP